MVLRAVGTLPSLRRVLVLLFPSPAAMPVMRFALTFVEWVFENRSLADRPGVAALAVARAITAAVSPAVSGTRGSVSRATVPPPGRGR